MVQREGFNVTGIFDLGGRVAVGTGGNGGLAVGRARGLARGGAAGVVNVLRPGQARG